MYNESLNQPESQKQPYWFENLEMILKQFDGVPHRDQVELFKELQSRLVTHRKDRQESLTKELESFAADVKSHYEGTSIIESGLTQSKPSINQ